MIEYRPVDCDTRQPLPFAPAYIDKSAIYRGGPRPGWSTFPQKAAGVTLITASGAGLEGGCDVAGYKLYAWLMRVPHLSLLAVVCQTAAHQLRLFCCCAAHLLVLPSQPPHPLELPLLASPCHLGEG